MLEWAEIERLIRLDMSPEQASCRLALECGLRISHETIYVHIYEDKRRGGDLWQHLRCQKPRRKRYAGNQERRGTIKNRIGIDERPGTVDQKSQLIKVTQEQVQWAVDRLNHRPRKVLGFRTPFEIFFGKTVRYTKSPLGVALRG